MCIYIYIDMLAYLWSAVGAVIQDVLFAWVCRCILTYTYIDIYECVRVCSMLKSQPYPPKTYHAMCQLAYKPIQALKHDF